MLDHVHQHALKRCHEMDLMSVDCTCEGHTSTSTRGLVHLSVHKRALGLCLLVTQLDHTLQNAADIQPSIGLCQAPIAERVDVQDWLMLLPEPLNARFASLARV